MKMDGITINIGVGISEDAVKRCEQILSMYLTDNPELEARIDSYDAGDHVERYLHFVPTEHTPKAEVI